MVSNGRAFQVYALDEVRNNLAFADFWATFNASLELVTPIKINCPISELLSDNLDYSGHIDQSSKFVSFSSFCVQYFLRERRPMKIICPYNSDGDQIFWVFLYILDILVTKHKNHQD